MSEGCIYRISGVCRDVCLRNIDRGRHILESGVSSKRFGGNVKGHA